MKIRFTLIAFLMFAASTFSQTQSDGNWEVGVDLLALVDSSFFIREAVSVGRPTDAFASSLLVKRRLSESYKLRCKLGFTFEERRRNFNELLPGQIDLDSGGSFGAYLSVGSERYVRRGKVSIFIAAEAFGYYYKSEINEDFDTGIHATPPTVYKIRDFYSDQKYGLNALVGVSVQIIPRLFISTEANLQFAYRREYSDYKQYGNAMILTVSGGNNLKRYIADLKPISAIYVIYQF